MLLYIHCLEKLRSVEYYWKIADGEHIFHKFRIIMNFAFECEYQIWSRSSTSRMFLEGYLNRIFGPQQQISHKNKLTFRYSICIGTRYLSQFEMKSCKHDGFCLQSITSTNPNPKRHYVHGIEYTWMHIAHSLVSVWLYYNA